MSDERDERRPTGTSGDVGGPAVPGATVPGRPTDFGAMLREARAAKGLELSDIAELTHVRKEYLRALEESRFEDLPEDVYTRNFVRLYAQAVGISGERALAAYQAERRRAGGLTTLEMRLEQERRGEPPPAPKRRPATTAQRRGGLPRIGPMVPTVLMVVVLVALAVWGFQTLLFRPNRPLPTTGSTPSLGATPAAAASNDAGAAAADAAESAGAGAQAAPSDASPSSEPRTVLVSITSTPEGGSVTIDGFALPGVTPIRDAPVTARSGRLLRVTLDGYEPAERVVDMSEGGTFDVPLEVARTADAASPDADAGADVDAGQIAIEIRAATWLEVYRSTARNDGERLVYTTAEPGQTYLFDLPVYLHVGNAAGVEVTLEGGAPFLLGSSGAVVGRAFGAP
ncbi:MAG: DUF4115 domain-containing protein [Trueperaceae bacterium]